MRTIAKWLACGVGLAATLTAFGTPATANAQELVRSVERGFIQTTTPADTTQPITVTPEMAADVLLAHQEYMKAIEAFQKIQPQTAFTYNKIGVAYQRLAMDAEARMSYGEAAWLNDDAKANYRKALKADRKYAPAYNNLGTIYFHGNDNNLAEHYYRKAIKLESKDAPFWSNLGAVYFAKREFRRGEEAYQRAFSLNPNIFDEIALDGLKHHESAQELAAMYLCFAEVYAQAGMKADAVEYLRKAFMEGLPDRQKVQQDVQLSSLRQTPEFQQLFAKPASR